MVISRNIKYILDFWALLLIQEGFRDPNPQVYLPARIGIFYLVSNWFLRIYHKTIYTSYPWIWTFLYYIGVLGLIDYCLVVTSRFRPNLLFLPATLSGKGLSSPWGNVLSLLTFPYFYLERLTYSMVTKQSILIPNPIINVYDEITSNIYLGMCPTLFDNKIPENTTIVVDLSNEFSKSIAANKPRKYYSFP
jgi:hypothetical protein